MWVDVLTKSFLKVKHQACIQGLVDEASSITKQRGNYLNTAYYPKLKIAHEGEGVPSNQLYSFSYAAKEGVLV